MIPEQLDPRAEQALTEALRAMTPAQRIGQIDAMWRCARNMILAQLREDHPAWSEAELAAAVAQRMSHGAIGDPAGGDDQIRGILRVSGPELDRDDIERWAVRLGVQSEWAEASGKG